jgi:transposase
MKKVNYIGMDVHKKNIVIAGSYESGKAEFIGEYSNTESGMKQLLKKLNKLTENYDLQLCYEAGPCGYSIKRFLEKHQYTCGIVAPSLIPTRAGDRVKTDKRDAEKLARLYHAHELTFINVPTEEQEGVRNLVRCRDDFSNDLRRSRQRLQQFFNKKRYSLCQERMDQGSSEMATVDTVR